MDIYFFQDGVNERENGHFLHDHHLCPMPSTVGILSIGLLSLGERAVLEHRMQLEHWRHTCIRPPMSLHIQQTTTQHKKMETSSTILLILSQLFLTPMVNNLHLHKHLLHTNMCEMHQCDEMVKRINKILYINYSMLRSLELHQLVLLFTDTMRLD